MAIRERMSGNEAVAVAMKQINPDVVAAISLSIPCIATSAYP